MHHFLKESAQFCMNKVYWQFICQSDIYKYGYKYLFILINLDLVEPRQVQYNTYLKNLKLVHYTKTALP